MTMHMLKITLLIVLAVEAPWIVSSGIIIRCNDQEKREEMVRVNEFAEIVLDSLQMTGINSPYVQDDNAIYRRYFGDPYKERYYGGNLYTPRDEWVFVSNVLSELLDSYVRNGGSDSDIFACTQPGDEDCDETECTEGVFGYGAASGSDADECFCDSFFTVPMFGPDVNSKVGIWLHEMTHRKGGASLSIEDVGNGQSICGKNGDSFWNTGSSCNTGYQQEVGPIDTVTGCTGVGNVCYSHADVLELAVNYPEGATRNGENYERFLQAVYVDVSGEECPYEINGCGDYDGDGVRDNCDNCPCDSNHADETEAEDSDFDQKGNACDDTPNFFDPGPRTPCNNDKSSAQLLTTSCDLYVASTLGATIDNEMSCPDWRGGTVSGGGPGIWYKFLGQGRNVSLSTCTGTIHDRDFDSMIRVYNYESVCVQWSWWWCIQRETQWTCVVANDDDDTDSCGTESGVSWYAHRGVWYYILVNEYDEDKTGAFALKFTT